MIEQRQGEDRAETEQRQNGVKTERERRYSRDRTKIGVQCEMVDHLGVLFTLCTCDADDDASDDDDDVLLGLIFVCL
ncbi:hypothetical protein P4O66_012458, partial [Electrophorus voltai]